MTLVSTIIRDAYRESNLLAISANPTAAEQAEGLRLLNRNVMSLFGNEIGEELLTFPLGGNNINRPSGFPEAPDNDWIVSPNSRLVLNLTSDTSVYLHPMPKDGARFAFIDKSGNLATNTLTVYANGYTIDSAASEVFATNSLTREYFFRLDTGNWARVNDLVAGDESPFPEEFDDLLIIELAVRLNPRNGVALDPQSVETRRSQLKKFRSRYRQSRFVGVELGLRRLVGVRNRPFDFDVSPDGFNTGDVL